MAAWPLSSHPHKFCQAFAPRAFGSVGGESGRSPCVFFCGASSLLNRYIELMDKKVCISASVIGFFVLFPVRCHEPLGVSHVVVLSLDRFFPNHVSERCL